MASSLNNLVPSFHGRDASDESRQEDLAKFIENLCHRWSGLYRRGQETGRHSGDISNAFTRQGAPMVSKTDRRSTTQLAVTESDEINA